ncbi:MAG: response regulator [Acidimicrobiia bacterium]|nr:response regulator [Acidimicrobiia bacterium]
MNAPVILVIEDSPVIWRLIRASCEDMGTFEWEADGVTGLSAVRRVMPDLVILDIGLPNLDGWGVLAGIRTNRDTATIPVLVLTAHADSASREKARTGGAQAFMTKPFRPSDLRTTIGLILDATRDSTSS